MSFREVLSTMLEFYLLCEHEFRGNSNSIYPFTDITLILSFSFSPIIRNKLFMDVYTEVIQW